ncbi:MAG: hypothetical protein R3F30_09355 [Planctomycetota bacterium]
MSEVVPAERRKLRSLDAAHVLVLVLLSLLMVGFRILLVDIHPADEIYYLCRGRWLLEGRWWHLEPAWGPVYSICYGVLDLLTVNGLQAMDFMVGLRVIGSTLALYWVFRALTGPGWAFAFAVVWLTGPCVTDLDRIWGTPRIGVFVFCAGLAFVALGCFLRRRTRWGLLVTALLPLCRPEWALAIPVLALLWWRRSRSGQHGRRAAILALAASLAALAFLAGPGNRARSWWAFRQHYAMLAAQRDPGPVPPGTDPFAEPDAIMRHDFGDAGSIPAAAVAAPGHFLAHLGHNLSALPEAFATAFLSPFGGSTYVRIATLIAFGLLLDFAFRRRRREVGRQDPFHWAMAFAISCTVAILSALLIQARSELLLPAAPLLYLMLASGAPRKAVPVGRWEELLACGFVVMLLGTTGFVGHFPPRSDRTAVVVLASPEGPRSGRLLGTNPEPYRDLLDLEDVTPLRFAELGVDADATDEALDRALELARPAWLLVTRDRGEIAAERILTRGEWTLVREERWVRLFRRGP